MLPQLHLFYQGNRSSKKWKKPGTSLISTAVLGKHSSHGLAQQPDKQLLSWDGPCQHQPIYDCSWMEIQLNEWSKFCMLKENKIRDFFSLPPIRRQMFSCFLLNKASVHVAVIWEGKCHNHEHPPFLLLSFSFHCWPHHTSWDIPLVGSRQMLWLFPLPISHPLLPAP